MRIFGVPHISRDGHWAVIDVMVTRLMSFSNNIYSLSLPSFSGNV